MRNRWLSLNWVTRAIPSYTSPVSAATWLSVTVHWSEWPVQGVVTYLRYFNLLSSVFARKLPVITILKPGVHTHDWAHIRSNWTVTNEPVRDRLHVHTHDWAHLLTKLSLSHISSLLASATCSTSMSMTCKENEFRRSCTWPEVYYLCEHDFMNEIRSYECGVVLIIIIVLLKWHKVMCTLWSRIHFNVVRRNGICHVVHDV